MAEQNTPLTGKYLKLKNDLKDALAATEYCETYDDDGTCNFDSPTLKLPRWSEKLVKQAAKEAGFGCFKWKWGGTLLGYVFSVHSSGQANRRSYRAEKISEYMENLGYDAGMYYQMD